MRQIIRGWGLILGVLLVVGWSVQPVVTKAGTGVSHYHKFFEWQTDMSGISALAWSPDSQQLAATSNEILQIWDASNGHMVNKMQVYSGPLVSLDWSPNGYILATGGDEGTIRLWDAKQGRELCVFLSPSESLSIGILIVKWSPDGKMIATGGYDGRVMLWDIAAGNGCRMVQPFVIPTIHPYPVQVVDWNRTGDRVMSMGLYNILPIWDAKTGQKRDEIQCPFSYSANNPCIFLSADWSHDGKYIVASGENGAVGFSKIWDVTTKESRDLIEMCTSAFSWMPKSNALVGWCDGQLEMFDADTLQMIGTTDFAAGYWEKGQDHLLNAYAISPDGQRIAISYQAGDGMNAIIQIFGVSPNGGG